MSHLAEKIATAVLISLVGGIFVFLALAGGVERAIFVWLLTVISSGLVVGRLDKLSVGAILKRTVWPALVLAVFFGPGLTFLVFFVSIHGTSFRGLCCCRG